MRTFEHFPTDIKCVLCGKSTDLECCLIPIDDTSNGKIEEAAPVHVVCITDFSKFRFNKKVGVIYMNIGE